MISLKSISTKVSRLVGKAGQGSVEIAQDSVQLMTEIYEEIGDIASELCPNTNAFFTNLKIPSLEELLESSFKSVSYGSMRVSVKFVNSFISDITNLCDAIDEFLTTSSPVLNLILKGGAYFTLSVATIKLISFIVFIISLLMAVAFLVAIYLMEIIKITIIGTVTLVATVSCLELCLLCLSKHEEPITTSLSHVGTFIYN